MNLLHTVASLHPDAGGPSRTVSATCQELANGVDEVHLATTHEDVEPALTPPERLVTSHLIKAIPYWWRPVRFRHEVQRIVRENNVSLVHDHGVWLSTNWASASAAGQVGVPLVVTTRGMLEPWALNHHRWRKRVAWYAYQRRILRQAALLHATSAMEADQLRRLGLDAPIAVIPNGVPIPENWKQTPSQHDERQMLFLSRIHPKKGLPMLIDAWKNVRPEGWRLVIAGPSERGHRAEIEAKIEASGLSENLEVIGPVENHEKWQTYRKSDVFVLPTHSENFGVVVAEALASGIPAITTTGAPWEILKKHNCGWWVEPTVEALTEAISDSVQRTDEERLAMGERGRELVTQKYSWSSVSSRLQRVYHWILEEGTPPSCVRLYSE